MLIDYQEEVDIVQSFISRSKLDFATILLDRFGKVAASFGALLKKDDGRTVVSLPLTVVADKDGIVRGIFTKEGSDYFERLASVLKPSNERPTLMK